MHQLFDFVSFLLFCINYLILLLDLGRVVNLVLFGSALIHHTYTQATFFFFFFFFNPRWCFA
jgi:hypothetical protein